MKSKKILALSLAILMLACCFAGCGGAEQAETTASASTSGTPETTAATEVTTEVTTEAATEVTTETTTEASANLEGYEFHLSCKGNPGFIPSADTAEGVELSDIYASIEEKLNCVIICESLDNDAATLLTAAIGGTKYADFVSCRQSAWIPLAMANGVRPLDEMTDAGLDLYNEENFNQTYTGMSKINGHIYALDMTGKYEYTRLGHYYAFNKDLTAAAGYTADDLYALAKDGKWNYELMLEVARKITDDTDGDGTPDVWGIALDTDGNEVWTNGTGPIVYDEAQSKWVSNVTDSRVIKALQFMYDISQNDVQTPVAGGIDRGARRQLFYDGTAGFAGLYGGNLRDDQYWNSVVNVGFLPLPMGPDATEYKMTLVDLTTFVCLTANTDWEKSAKVINEIGAAVTDFSAYKDKMLEQLRGDQDGFDMLIEYALPGAQMNIAKCSDDMHTIMRKGLFQSVYELSLTPAAAAETYDQQIQAQLDYVFRQQ